MTFRHRLALVAATAVAVAVVLSSVVVYVVVRDQLRDQVDESLFDLADRATFAAAAPPFIDGAPPIFEEVAPGRPPREIVFALPAPPLGGATGIGQLVNDSGDVLRRSGEGFALPVGDATREVASGERERLLEDADVGGTHLRVLTAQVAPGNAVQVARSLEEVDGTLRDLALLLVVVSIAGVALAAGLGRAVAQTAVAPVARLTDAAEHVTRTGDLASRIDGAERDDELGRLATSFNEMLAELERATEAQRQLIADASHELRTPLTSLRTNIEVLAGPNGLEPSERERLLADVVEQTAELGTLVGNLVDLARGEEPYSAAEELRFDELVATAIERAERHSRAVAFRAELEPCTVVGIRERLERAVGNLLDNAAKWSPPGGEVRVVLAGGELSIGDQGPGIEPGDLPHVFDRFYRAASARSMAGSGLGLAIVRQVAEAHGGSVVAGPADGGGALLRLRLPVRAPAAPAL